MHFKDMPAAANIGQGHHHLPVKTAGPLQGRVQHVGTVGGRDQDHALVGFKAVHFHQKLVKGLLALVVPAAEAGAALSTHGVDFVNENQAGSVLFALGEQIAHTGRANAHKHLHKVRTGNGKERHSGFAGHGFGQQSLARARRADEKHALGDAPAKTSELLGIGQKVHNLGKLLLGFVHPGHIVKGNAGRLLRNHAGARTAEGHGLAPAPLHLAHEKHPEQDQQDHGSP